MAKKIREFMTHRDPDEHIWVERDESAVIGTARMGQRMVPKIRPFDLLRSTPRSANGTRATVWEGDSLRIGTEHIDGLRSNSSARRTMIWFISNSAAAPPSRANAALWNLNRANSF